MEADLKDLVELSKEGDQEAIAQLYDRTKQEGLLPGQAAGEG